jgi:hypothetical protein
MTIISNLPALSVTSGSVTFPVLDVDGVTKQATFEQLNGYVGGVTVIATTASIGGVIAGTGINVDPQGVISVNTAGITVVYNLTTATTSTLGGVKIGTGISIDTEGVISATTATPYILNSATTATLGGVKIGSGISIDEEGVISAPNQYVLPVASTGTLGGVKTGAGVSIDAGGVISVAPTTATFSAQGFFALNSDETAGYVTSWNGKASYAIVRDKFDETKNAAMFYDDNYYIDEGTRLRRGIFGVVVGGSYYDNQFPQTATGFIADFLRVSTSTSELNIFGANNPNAVLSVKGTTNYENNVIDDDHIPNKKYVDSIAVSGGLGSRTTKSTSSISILANSATDVQLAGYRSYALMSLGVNTASWVTIYTSASARSADANRIQGTDPSPGAGVIAEIITTGSSTISVSPAAIGYNDDVSLNTTIYIKAVNLWSAATSITVTAKILPMEA